MVLYHGTTAECPAQASNSTWDASRGGFLFFHSRTTHSIFHVNYKIPPCVWLMQNGWGPSCVILWYIFKIPNTLVPLWCCRLRHRPCPHVIMSLGPAADSCLTPSLISFSLLLLLLLHSTELEKHQKQHKTFSKKRSTLLIGCVLYELNIVTFCMWQESSFSRWGRSWH